MPFRNAASVTSRTGNQHEIEADYDILEAIGALYEDLSEGLARAGAPQKTVRRWLVGHRDAPGTVDARIALLTMATDLEMFTPSLSGKTPVDRYLDQHRPQSDIERAAFGALRAAQFHLVRVIGRESGDLVGLEDLATHETLVLLNARISPLADGVPTAMRLCPLASGRHVLISPLFMIDDAILAAAMRFVKPGKRLGNGYRCAASLYRDVARSDFTPMPQLLEPDAPPLSIEPEMARELSEIQYLAMRWMVAEGAAAQAEVTVQIRQAASLDNLIDVFGWLAKAMIEGPRSVREAMTRVAEIQMETIVQRAQAGIGGYEGVLDRAAAMIAGRVAAGAMAKGARDMFDKMRARWSAGDAARPRTDKPANGPELDRVIQRILALRAKTVDQGCTEEEAMAAAAKVAELLDRYDLSLDEVAVRQSDCAGATVQTSRRRRAPVDSCVQPVAMFCDCRAWSEDSPSGALRYVFFGLRADVEAARFLYDLIEITFETEAAAFRDNPIYLKMQGGARRSALNAFQIGLANGINTKLDTLKHARHAAAAVKSTGFDLVAVKHAVVDEEIDKLGLHFTTRTSSARR